MQNEDATPDVVTLKWERPRTDGGSPLYGYLVEHRRTGSPQWVRSAPTLILYPEVALSGLEPGWRYQFRVSAENAVGMSECSELSDPLTVTLQRNAVAPPRFVTDLQDSVAIENEKIEFTVSIAGTPPPQINWFKDGFEVFSSRRTKIVNENNTSMLIIHQTALTDEGEIKCTATNRAGHVATKGLLKIEAPPKIRLPRQYEDGLLIEADEVIRLKVGLAGRPSPIVVWCHNGEVIKDGGRYELATNDRNSTLKINNSIRSDRGEYNLRAINKLGDDNVSFLVTVTDRPSMPGKVMMTMSIGKSATLSWTAPEDDGGCKIGNYVVEYFRIGWNVWLKAVTTRQLTATLNDLIEGSEYKFRVKAESPYGMSDPSEESEVLFVPDPKRGLNHASRSAEFDTGPPSASTSLAPSTLPPKKRYLSPRRSEDSKKIDKQEQTVSKSISLDVPQLKPRLPSPQVYDTDVIAREMSYGTTSDVFNMQMELKHELNQNDAQLLRDMTYDTSEDTYNPRRKVLKSTIEPVSVPKPEAKPVIPQSILKNTSNYNENLRKSIDEQRQLHKKEIQIVNNYKKETLKVEQDSHEEVHTSNEFVLVLYDKDDNKEDGHKGNVCSLYTTLVNSNILSDCLEEDTEFDSILPPQLSLSTPELGLESPATPTMRRCVSSTELLYEKAMQRFYQAVQLEESETKNRRSESVDPQSRHDLPSSRKRLSSFGEADAISLERRNSLRLRFSNDAVTIAPKTNENRNEKMFTQEKELTEQKIEERLRDNELPADEERDLKKEIQESQRKLSIAARNLTPTSSVEFEEDYTDSTASSASMSSLDSMEKFKNVIRTISIEKQEELDTYNPMMSSRTVSSSNIRTIGDDVIDTSRLSMDRTLADSNLQQRNESCSPPYIHDFEIVDKNQANVEDYSEEAHANEENDNSDENVDEESQYDSEKYHPRRDLARALSPYRTPEADQSTIALTKPLPMPSADFVPKPILKRSSAESTQKEKKSKPKTKTSKTERKSIMQLFKKTPSNSNLTEQNKLETTAVSPPAEEPKMSPAALAKKKSMERRQTSLEENKVAIDHYSDIVKELSGTRKPKVPIYMSSEELKKAAEKEAIEANTAIRQQTISPTPVVERKLITPTPPSPSQSGRSTPNLPTGLKESSARSIFATKLSKDPKKMAEMRAEVKPLIDNRSFSIEEPDTSLPVDFKLEQQQTSPEITKDTISRGRAPKSDDTTTKKRNSSGTRSQSQSARRTKMPKDPLTSPSPTPAPRQRSVSKTRTKSQSKSPSAANRRPLHVARIRDDSQRSAAQTPEPRSQTPEQLLDEAEKSVKSTMVYFTDITMLIVACWVYMFKDARLVLPILALMVYRQAGKALKNKIPKWMKRKSSDNSAEPEPEDQN